MLRQSVFVACISNLYGQGYAGSGLSKPSVTLTWGQQANAVTYAVFRSTTAGGTAVQVGTTAYTSFTDKTFGGLVNGSTYYYTVQPLNGNSQAICSSNQMAVKIP
jgi:fibronectin type 3 domain-containing protein